MILVGDRPHSCSFVLCPQSTFVGPLFFGYSEWMSSFSSIPSLPSPWPFPLRTARQSFATRPLSEIPGLQGAWHLIIREDLEIQGEPEPMEEAFGRGGIFRVGDVVVRPYRRGGLVRFFDETLYANPMRFNHELTVHRALWAAGVPTVEPLGYAYRRKAWGVEGVYLTRREEVTPWPHCWERSEEILPRLKALLEPLCAWGVWAPDLNATNVLVASDGSLRLLDWDRTDWILDQPLLPKYRARLLRSLKKLGAPESVQQGLLR